MAELDAASVDSEEDRDWDGWTEDGEAAQTPCPVCGETSEAPAACIAHLAEEHNVDLRAIKAKLKLNYHECVRMVNRLRACPTADLLADASWRADDALLTPILAGDPLLTADEFDDGDDDDGDNPLSSASSLLAQLRSENAALREQLATLILADDDDNDNRPSTSSAPPKNRPNLYFQSYARFDIHRQMLLDDTRTLAYRRALVDSGVCRNAVALDVGAGTGVLTLFALQGGASHAIGVEASPPMADTAAGLIASNASSKNAHIYRGRSEDAALDAFVEQHTASTTVGVLVSEWMGYALLFEDMLPSVLAARDRLLAPGGAMVPRRATMTLGFASARASYHYLGKRQATPSAELTWNDVYGLDFSDVAKRWLAEEAKQASVMHMSAATPSTARCPDILTTDAVFADLNLETCTSSDLEFTQPFRVDVDADAAAACAASLPKGVPQPAALHACALWFATELVEGVWLDTAPHGADTHWGQVVLPLPEPIADAVAVEGTISFAREPVAEAGKEARRGYDIALAYRAVRGDGTKSDETVRVYELH